MAAASPKALDPPLRVVLVEPEIPPNTGNIARMCAATGTELVLAGRLGFELSDRYLKRGGMDYWRHVRWRHVPDFEAAIEGRQHLPFWLFTTRATRSLYDIAFAPGHTLVFGKETAGLDAALLARYPGALARIPMLAGIRSLNLSSSAAVAVYEALRQCGWGGSLP